MKFEIATADAIAIDDAELFDLLNEVYVGGGYTKPEEAHTIFEPQAVRGRGVLIAARAEETSALVGMVILVPADSHACRRAKHNEAELHLLGVKREYRRFGLGRMLVNAAIEKAHQSGYTKLILWTQISMDAAQRLYESIGFIHVDNFERNGRHFKIYEMTLGAQ
jgi:ribosomal protein S18 acetylase RimI-like enzyme